MKDNKWVIWSNWNLDIDDECYTNYWKEMEEDCGELSDDEKWKILYEQNGEWLEDERLNLNVKLEDEIVVIADLGLWYGRRGGYKLIKSGNISDCLCDSADYLEWYCDRYNFRCRAAHHDGTNYYLYRVLRSELSWEQRENFLNKLYNGEVNDRMIRRYTKSIRPYIADVYGWNWKSNKEKRKAA